MAEREPVIHKFPKGTWWVTWVDNYQVPHLGTATPSVEVFLSPLPEQHFSLSTFKNAIKSLKSIDPTSNISRRRLVGEVPILKIGTIFRDGAPAGELQTEEVLFITDTRKFKPQMLEAGSSFDDFAPSWWDKNMPYRVINRAEYPLGNRFRSNCLVLQNDKCIMALPCHEIFRALYAPHSKFAVALTSGPWESTCSEIVNPERTGKTEDGRWQIVLRDSIDNDFALFFANLWFNPHGKAEAKKIYANLLAQGNSGLIQADLPFKPGVVAFKIRAVQLQQQPLKYLGIEIIEVRWTTPNIEIIYSRDNDNSTGEIKTPVDKPSPYSGSTRVVGGDDGEDLLVTAEEDPSHQSPVTTFKSKGLKWISPPQITKLQKLESNLYLRPYENPDTEKLTTASAGKPFYGQTNSAQANFSTEERRPTTNRFREMIALLDSLQMEKDIKTWEILPPEKHPHFRGEIPVWPFPLRIKDQFDQVSTHRWSYLDATEKIRRTALVAAIDIGAERVIVIEVECRPSENGFKTLLFRSTIDHGNTMISTLLGQCTRQNGIWPRAQPMFPEIKPIVTAATWKHHYFTTGILDRKSFMNALGRIQ